MIKKESGTDWFNKLVHGHFKIPYINPIPKFGSEIPKEAALFINGDSNLILISCNYYAWCIKMLRLKFMGNLDVSLKWLSQSELTPIYDRHSTADIICLVNLFEEQKKGMLGGFVNTCLNNGSQLLIGVPEGKILNEAFPYDLDTLEHEFEVLKI